MLSNRENIHKHKSCRHNSDNRAEVSTEEYLLLEGNNLYSVNQRLSLKRLLDIQVLAICESSYIKQYEWYYVEDLGYNTLMNNKYKPEAFRILVCRDPFVGIVCNPTLDCIIAVTTTDIHYYKLFSQEEYRPGSLTSSNVNRYCNDIGNIVAIKQDEMTTLLDNKGQMYKVNDRFEWNKC